MPIAPALKYQLAASALRQGAVMAYPTEAVWGMGCDPHNRSAIARLLTFKGRPAHKGLILVASSMDQFAPYLQGLEPSLLAKLEESWPGPTTWLVPHNGYAPQWIKGRHDSVALRVSAHKPVVQLCQAFAGPLVSTSANYSGEQPPHWPWQLQRRLGHGLDLIVHGPLGGSRTPSEIRDLVTGRVLRPA